ncbi:hypothetical protein [Paraburkholderia antibiotica]|uniref:Uncharacterized protein n=1 Tax=Paraburkholderia antibiotica TaxID=2728839 RepID=A0A7X9X707_9BURK|nr:hypothetical protein [Paraburkholderia antibiotica]NML32508.1 hypothetical protein [Paraburkholderia antibiotica]
MSIAGFFRRSQADFFNCLLQPDRLGNGGKPSAGMKTAGFAIRDRKRYSLRTWLFFAADPDRAASFDAR